MIQVETRNARTEESSIQYQMTKGGHMWPAVEGSLRREDLSHGWSIGVCFHSVNHVRRLLCCDVRGAFDVDRLGQESGAQDNNTHHMIH